MRTFLRLLLFHLLLSTSTIVVSGASTPRIFKASASIPPSWKNVGSPSAKNAVQFSLYIEAPDRSGLTAKMVEISRDPNAKWLTSSEIARYITPTADTQTTIKQALTSAGIPASNVTFSSLKDRVVVTTTVALAEKFLGTKLESWSHNGGPAVPKAQSATLPASISSKVYSVGTLLSFGEYVGTTQASRKRIAVADAEQQLVQTRQTSNSSIPASCRSAGGHYYAFPRCIIDLYGLPQPKKSLRRRNDLAVVGYLGENMSQKDLSQALTAFRPDQPSAAKYQMTVKDLFGASNNASNPTGEAALDAQIIAGLTFPLQTSYYNIGDADGKTVGSDDGDIFLTAFQTFLEQDPTSRPQVVAVSYGILDESSMTATADAMCNAAQVLSAMGTTIIFASGDSGPDSVARAFAQSYPDQSGYCPRLRPGYPVGCPYILSVGATGGFGAAEQPVYYGHPSGLNGTTWDWASGSGFSDKWSTPSWQSSALSKWLGSSNSLYSSATAGQFNKAGRAYPDVVALGIDYPIVLGGNAFLQAGTSMAAPVMGSVFALLNDQLLAAGKPLVGWVNPMLYSNPAAFTDITKGGSYWRCGSGTASTAQQYGFNCTTGGWDAASGLGSPNYAKLKALWGL